MSKPNRSSKPQSHSTSILFKYFIILLVSGVVLWNLFYVFQTKPNKIINTSSTNNLDLSISHLRTASDNQNESELHIVFSTDCSYFQDWQSLVVFHSAKAVGQVGQITRVASGCDEDKAKELKDLYRKLFPDYHIHATPDFKKDGKSQKSYDFYNKPYGTVI